MAMVFSVSAGMRPFGTKHACRALRTKPSKPKPCLLSISGLCWVEQMNLRSPYSWFWLLLALSLVFWKAKLETGSRLYAEGPAKARGDMVDKNIPKKHQMKGRRSVYGVSLSEDSRAAYKLPLFQLSCVTAGWLEPHAKRHTNRERKTKRGKNWVKCQGWNVLFCCFSDKMF